MTETATTSTTAKNFQHNSVVNNIIERNDGRIRKINSVHIFNNTFFYSSRSSFVDNFYFCNRTIFIVNAFIEARHIDALNFNYFIQETLTTANFTSFLPSFVSFHNFNHDFFTFTDDSKVKEISQRFRIINARTTYDNEGVVIFTVCGQNGHIAQVQHIQNIGVGKFVLQGKAYNVTFRQSFFSLQSTQGNVAFTHFSFHINPRSIYALSLHTCSFVQKVIQNFEAQIAHANFVNVRESQGNSCFYFFSRFNNAAKFTAGIAGWLLHTAQYVNGQFFFHHILLKIVAFDR